MTVLNVFIFGHGSPRVSIISEKYFYYGKILRIPAGGGLKDKTIERPF
jgi:hypothetical protein